MFVIFLQRKRIPKKEIREDGVICICGHVIGNTCAFLCKPLIFLSEMERIQTFLQQPSVQDEVLDLLISSTRIFWVCLSIYGSVVLQHDETYQPCPTFKNVVAVLVLVMGETFITCFIALCQQRWKSDQLFFQNAILVTFLVLVLGFYVRDLDHEHTQCEKSYGMLWFQISYIVNLLFFFFHLLVFLASLVC